MINHDLTDSGLIRLLEKYISNSKGNRSQRIWKTPKKILFSKVLELIEKLFGTPIKIKAKTFWNEDMLIVIPEAVSIYIYRYGFYEEGLTKFVLNYLKPGMTFFDIGAHFGYYTLLASHIVGKYGQVHSFEPTPSTFEVLKINTRTKKNVVINKLAAFTDTRVIELHDCGLQYCAFNSFRGPRLDKNIINRLKSHKVIVKAISLDTYVQQNEVNPDFIKIDAEGLEYEVLHGMERTIAKFKPIISIETGDFGVKDVPMSIDLIQFLMNKGYQPYECRNGKISKHNLRNEIYQYDNILFLPGD